jgi:hypothetical protein
MTMTPRLFALLILDAQERHENSWVPAKNAYAKSHTLSAHEALDKMNEQKAERLSLDWVEPLTLLNTVAWNDIQDWAKKQVRTATTGEAKQ